MQAMPLNTSATDPYEVLGLERNANKDAIRSAFRMLALKYHPDRNPNAEAAEEFVRIRRAYEILQDPEFRGECDAEFIEDFMTQPASELIHKWQKERELRKGVRASISVPQPLYGLFRLEESRALQFTIATVLLGSASIAAAGILALPHLVVTGLLVLPFSVPIWLSRGFKVELHINGEGFSDSSWGSAGRINWADVHSVDTDHSSRSVEFQIREEIGKRLRRSKNRPPRVLVKRRGKWYYRIQLRNEFERVFPLVEESVTLAAEVV